MSPKTQEQFEETRAKSREKIMLAAFELFALNGYHTTSISKIAAKAGFSKGLLYNYFSSKETLLDEIVTEGLQEIGALSSLLEEEKEPHDKLETLIRATCEMLKTQKEYWRFYASIIMQVDVMESIRGKIIRLFEIMIKDIENIFTDMGIEKPEIEACKFGAMIDGISLHYTVFFKDDYPIDDVMESLIEQYCKPKKTEK